MRQEVKLLYGKVTEVLFLEHFRMWFVSPIVYVGYEVAQGRPFGRPTCIPRKYSNSKQSFT